MPKLRLRDDGAPIIRAHRRDDRNHPVSTYQVTPHARDWLRKRGIERDGDTVSHDELFYLLQRSWIHTEADISSKPAMIQRPLTAEERRIYGVPDPSPEGPAAIARPPQPVTPPGGRNQRRPASPVRDAAERTPAIESDSPRPRPEHLARRTKKQGWFS